MCRVEKVIEIMAEGTAQGRNQSPVNKCLLILTFFLLFHFSGSTWYEVETLRWSLERSILLQVHLLASTISVYVTYFLGYWNKENVRKIKNINLNGWSFYWPLLDWMLYFPVRVQNNRKILFAMNILTSYIKCSLRKIVKQLE